MIAKIKSRTNPVKTPEKLGGTANCSQGTQHTILELSFQKHTRYQTNRHFSAQITCADIIRNKSIYRSNFKVQNQEDTTGSLKISRRELEMNHKHVNTHPT